MDPSIDDLILISQTFNITIDKLISFDYLTINSKLSNFDFKFLCLDVDGVQTDGGMYFTSDGNEVKKFFAKDGMAIKKLTKIGKKVGFISSGLNEDVIRYRANVLDVTHIYVGIEPKLPILEKWCEELAITLQQVAYIGDDINDLEVIKHVGLSACPADAVEKIKQSADITLNTNGGYGCVREFVSNFLYQFD